MSTSGAPGALSVALRSLRLGRKRAEKTKSFRVFLGSPPWLSSGVEPQLLELVTVVKPGFDCSSSSTLWRPTSYPVLAFMWPAGPD